MSKRFIPFEWLPRSWGVSGNDRKRLKAEYEYSGYELEMALNSLDHTGDELLKSNLNTELKYNKISEKEYDYSLAKINDNPEYLLNIKLKHGDITKTSYNKELSTLKNEPWVHIVDIRMDQNNPSIGALELDWNDIFVEHLRESGYSSESDDKVVDMWITDVCRNIALQELDGVGTFTEDSEESLNIQRTSDGKVIIK